MRGGKVCSGWQLALGAYVEQSYDIVYPDTLRVNGTVSSRGRSF